MAIPPSDLPPDQALVSPLPAPPAPRPRGPLSLVILAFLACGYTLWAAQAVILPVLLACFLALIGNPIIRGLQKLYIPRFLGAIFVLVLGLAATAALAYQMVPPAAAWAKAAPRELRQLAPKLQLLAKPVYDANQAAENFARAASGDTSRRPQVMRTADDPYRTLTTTPRMVASVLAVVLLTFFFMVYGETLQRHAIALLPRRQQQKLTFGILHSIERSVSRYVLTISIINFVVGMLFAGALYLMELPVADALLWGTLVALLNFAPYVGPLIGMVMMLVVGLTTFDDGLQSLLPAAIYLGLHTLEGQLVTPIVLGRQMRLSPLILILALMVFGSLWGIIGLLLAVPMLVCIKLVLAKVQGMEGWARLME
ncbi:Predicted PurR-regulated permease PerM [Pseudoxanthomonas sp. GM95]|uniref:AI-2E family transporter n=1 Tax=Pseudoxanthomonas sp. GM95 TaxID=1881043 RepID=UPI0008B8D89B|nr:AI-2E family transporter [Pseudoxanthomonas sp. GM95]SEL51073.1 Predicted PurR-regulated permease PerM [Pseudoxanthomonas sp. GM95]